MSFCNQTVINPVTHFRTDLDIPRLSHYRYTWGGPRSLKQCRDFSVKLARSGALAVPLSTGFISGNDYRSY